MTNFKVGDMVRVLPFEKILSMADLTNSSEGMIYCKENIEEDAGFDVENMKKYCGCAATITIRRYDDHSSFLRFDSPLNDDNYWIWEDWMLEPLNGSEEVEQEEKSLFCVTNFEGIVGFIELTTNEREIVKRVLRAVDSGYDLCPLAEASRQFLI